jgi:hypothetical protein
MFPENSSVFTKLSTYPISLLDEDHRMIERFIILMYDRSTSAADIDSVRLDIFARKKRLCDAITPTQAALKQHTKRATYQAGCIGEPTTKLTITEECPKDWGWTKCNEQWEIVWTTAVAESCKELTKCGCKSDCSGRCKCFRFGLVCTELCSCTCNVWINPFVTWNTIIADCVYYKFLSFVLKLTAYSI